MQTDNAITGMAGRRPARQARAISEACASPGESARNREASNGEQTIRSLDETGGGGVGLLEIHSVAAAGNRRTGVRNMKNKLSGQSRARQETAYQLLRIQQPILGAGVAEAESDTA